MKITCIVIGKTDEKYVQTGIQKYAQRLSHFCTFSIVEIPDIARSKKISVDEQKKKEGEVILQKIHPSAHVILLDQQGTQYSSIEFANKIEQFQNNAIKEIVFVIGGPYGFSNEIYSKKFQTLSCSKMTFSHQMIRLFLLEQLYRAQTIIKGLPYHHE
ncbi:MAG TPA: 23S rRNA (pseudouridine(1915)-N(3))-methyltransferase RlmH [Bacteroidales bacterium]|nr:23S rRNA (pseudouridine(1915)-N(3))-methyltransferase RlmH [Bacteroidales bacterium]